METIKSINSIYEKIVIAIEKQIYPQIDIVLNNFYEIFINDKLKFNIEKIQNVSNMLVFSFLIFGLIYYMSKQIMLVYSGENNRNIFKYILKIILLYIISTNTIFILEFVINIFNILDDFIKVTLESITSYSICFASISKVIDITDFSNYDFFTVEGMIKSVVCYGCVNILLNLSIKFVSLIVIIVTLPIIIMTSAIEIKNNILRKCLYNLLTILLVPLIINFIIGIILMFKGIDDILFNIILLGCFNILIKIDIFLKGVI